MEAVLLLALAKDYQRARKRLGQVNAPYRFGFGFGTAAEALKERPRRVQAPCAAVRFLWSLEKWRDEPEFGYEVLSPSRPRGRRIAFVPLHEIVLIIVLVVANGPCLPWHRLYSA